MMVSMHLLEIVLIDELDRFILADLADLLELIVTQFIYGSLVVRIEPEPLMVFDYDHFVPVLQNPPDLSDAESSSVSSQSAVSTLWNVI